MPQQFKSEMPNNNDQREGGRELLAVDRSILSWYGVRSGEPPDHEPTGVSPHIVEEYRLAKAKFQAWVLAEKLRNLWGGSEQKQREDQLRAAYNAAGKKARRYLLYNDPQNWKEFVLSHAAEIQELRDASVAVERAVATAKSALVIAEGGHGEDHVFGQRWDDKFNPR